jgi:uncharacterized circularly permuted ATP-grasp superfamily protein/uncharacterized alpha-E superfamily protein
MTTYDESSADGITPREQWVGLMDSLRILGAHELEHRYARADRRIRENGMTYNVYGDPQGANRPWAIDLVPLLISAREWQSIEAGVIQRAKLLNLVLEDLYGSQDLLKDGHFPAALLYANPQFLRPLVGVAIPAHSYLHMLAVDLARSPDGQWWILADRTQAPSGSGYALENRTIVSDLLPELFRASNVLRVAPFFRAQRETLCKLAGHDNPRVVLMTPGPSNETYFEQSYLAKYLDFTLVEGADLTVRKRRVYLKTVSGLEQVDVILRRVDDDFCDPLELRGDSLLGVPGLVDAVAAGNVRVANALGSGLIESAAIMPFLPGLARHLLGEVLTLPSVATWWCGQEEALDWTIKHLESVVIKPAFPAIGMEPVFGSELPPSGKAKLISQIRERPHEYVAQEQVALSKAPVWENGSLSSRSIVLRTYVLNSGTGWMAFPGGLVRVAEANGSVVSMQRGGHSKDAWVLWDGPIDTFSMLRSPDEPVQLRRVPRVVPSSVADNTFWLGRYVERAEHMARILRSMVSRVHRAEEGRLDSLVRLHGCLGLWRSTLPKSKRKPPTFASLETEVSSMLTNAKRSSSLPSALNEVARIGGKVRERLSSDMVLLISQLRISMRGGEGEEILDFSSMLTHCLGHLSAFSGMERENINRGSGWLFLSIGRRLERAICLTRLLQAVAAPVEVEDTYFLDAALEVADSSMTYRTRYYTTLQALAVLDVLMADETNPRSLDFQLAHLIELYEKLPLFRPADLEAIKDALAGLRRLELQSVDICSPMGIHTDGRTYRAHALAQTSEYLIKVKSLLLSWSENLSGQYFDHARTQPILMGQ